MIDSHNHLQDKALQRCGLDFPLLLRAQGVTAVMVNGTCEADWPAISSLARSHPGWAQASYGLHPWFFKNRTADWLEVLTGYLKEDTASCIGEIGLDRWIKDGDIAGQTAVFRAQLRLARELERPATIHCLRAWDLLQKILKEEPFGQNFLLHSYSGPLELVKPLADQGAWFSFSGYFLHERKQAAREVFRRIPKDRLLVETDAPSMMLPNSAHPFLLTDPETGAALNHPGNLAVVCHGLANLLGMALPKLAGMTAENHRALFSL